MNAKKTALITGGSKGLGFALGKALTEKDYTVIITGRHAKQLLEAKKQFHRNAKVFAVAGDVRDEVHLLELFELIKREGLVIDLLVNNASTLGKLPMPMIMDQPVEDLHLVFHTNLIAPVSLIQKLQSHFSLNPTIINISSDAAIGIYENWGPYGASKAALDHISLIMAKENPRWKIYAFDPGDMRTDMHQDAFPGEDISDRPLPQETAVPAILQLLDEKPVSGRYTYKTLKSILV